MSEKAVFALLHDKLQGVTRIRGIYATRDAAIAAGHLIANQDTFGHEFNFAIDDELVVWSAGGWEQQLSVERHVVQEPLNSVEQDLVNGMGELLYRMKAE